MASKPEAWGLNSGTRIMVDSHPIKRWKKRNKVRVGSGGEVYSAMGGVAIEISLLLSLPLRLVNHYVIHAKVVL